MSDFINNNRKWNLDNLRNCLPTNIIEKVPRIPILINNIVPIPINNIDDKLNWEFSTGGQFSVKTATWANNSSIPPYTKAILLNSLWKLKLRPKLYLFAWKFLKVLPMHNKIRSLGASIDGDCPFFHKEEEILDHL